jgi:hypothetical protein
MSIASSEQQPAKHHRFGAAIPHIPISVILLAAAIAVALLIESRNNRSPEQVAHLEGSHPFLTQVKASIDPLTHWQPRSGQIRITLESTGKANLADANLSVYFRWRTKSNTGEWVRTPNLHVLELQNAQKLTVAARVPELLDAPSNGLKGWIFGGGNGLGEFLGVVPVADVWITAKANGVGDAALADVVESIGVTSMWVALAAGVGAVLLLVWFLQGFKPKGLKGANLCLQIIETRGGRASLSQFQIVLWVFVIGGATAYVMALSGNLVPLTEGTLALLGISGVATLASQVKASNPAEPPAPQAVKERAAAPSWRDLISSADGEIDVTRLQMLFFTVLIALFVAIHVLDNFQIPEIPTSFLQLMGLSNGVYIASKFIPNMTEKKPTASTGS